MPGLIFVMALYSFPYVFSMIANVCELISSDLEDAAEILGAEPSAYSHDHAAGMASGSVIVRAVRQRFAPKISAASSRSEEISSQTLAIIENT